MSSKYSNFWKAKYSVTQYNNDTTTPLDILDRFIEVTHERNFRNYIEIAKMLNIEPNKAQRLLYRTELPDKRVSQLMLDYINGSYKLSKGC